MSERVSTIISTLTRRIPAAMGAAAVAALAYTALAQGTQLANPETAGEVTFLGHAVAPETLTLGAQIYAGRCASCHGAKLEGQPDWKRRLANGRMPAPPHDMSGHTWHHSDQDLFLITKKGIGAVVPGYESNMPVFSEMLSDEEITAVLAWIKSTWPERQRGFQAEVTANDEPEGGS